MLQENAVKVGPTARHYLSKERNVDSLACHGEEAAAEGYPSASVPA